MVDQLKDGRTDNLYGKTKLFAAVAFLFSTQLTAEISVSANLFLGRSFSANIAREMLMTGPINTFNDGTINGFFAIDAVYQRAWNQNQSQGIGAYPFWSNFNSMTVGNSTGNANLDAYQFGLGDVSTVGMINLNPIIYQDGADFMFYVRSSQYGHSLFAKLKSAVTAMVVYPELTESKKVTPQAYAPGALTNLNNTGSSTTTPDPSNSILQAFAGATGGQTAQGDFRPMEYGLINGKLSTGAHMSDIEMTAGYQYNCPDTDNMFSIGARITAPTGTKPQGVYILEPINGRGGNWGVGFYLAGTYEFWHSTDNKLQLNFMSSGIHLCSAQVNRSYDLIANGHGSKYLLVADYQGGSYQNSIQNLVNLSTLQSQSSFGFEGDAALALSFTSGGFSADLGYNAWGRTKENLTIVENFNTQRYAILGRQAISNATNGALLNLCQPTATINSSVAAQTAVGNGAVDATIASNRISGNESFDTTITAQYAAVTSKLFTKIGYNWKECECCPYLNLMGECEWSNISNNALPQWSLSLIFGVSL